MGQDDLEKRIIGSSFLNCQDAASKGTIAPTRIQKQQHYADGFQYHKRSSSCASFLPVRFYIAGHTVRKLKESDTGSKSVCTSIEIPNPCQYACQTEIDLSLSFEDNAHSVGIPPIIKASVLMLDKMIAHQGKFNILVFPERIQSIFIFTLIKLLHNIAEGKIERAYDPEAFKPGEKLKLGNAVVEFVGIEGRNSEQRMRIKVVDKGTPLIIDAPIENFPLFQLTNTQRRLSTYNQYIEEKRKLEDVSGCLTPDEKFLTLLSDYRTHMDSSIVNMTSVINAKELFSICKLCGRDIKDILLIGHADYEGNVRNIGAGQLDGIPAIVLASDLYAIAALAEQGHPIQSIIIDGSNANTLLSQMDALDELMRLGVPITCVTETRFVKGTFCKM